MYYLILVMINLKEQFCKFFLYQLIGRVLGEIRFDTREKSDKLNQRKIWVLSNFIIDLHLELRNIVDTNKKYSDLFKEYENQSINEGISEWFEDVKLRCYETFCKRNDLDPACDIFQ